MSILVGVSPGQRSTSVMHLAAMLARSLDTPLVVAAVLPQSWSPLTHNTDREWRDHVRQSADVVLDHAASVLVGVKATFVQHTARSAHKGLLELIEEHKPDLVVLGSSSAGSLGQISLGSVSDALLHASPVPVAIAPRGFRASGAARVTRVTAAYGGSDAAADVVRGAAVVAGTIGASLRIASFAVTPSGSVTAGVGRSADRGIADEWVRDIEDHVRSLLDDVAALPRPPRLEGAVVGLGDSWATALEDVEWRAGDVLVVGSSTLGPLARVFIGSHATKVVRHSPVPAVIVPRRAAAELADAAEEGAPVADGR
ncbi:MULTISPECIES: universal stress protein [Microbacterium]|uniref:universal stress protein n=1 Tax=Microbacterium TaxID=33882 RepID=UPI00217DC440|nr:MULTISPECIES: universal stress protein [Microbacterium]UWF77705.1 universal stress protein [Microbacterium neungamense]WCM55874.1 universal stress protein [Microbacterium sp. EF45047]